MSPVPNSPLFLSFSSNSPPLAFINTGWLRAQKRCHHCESISAYLLSGAGFQVYGGGEEILPALLDPLNELSIQLEEVTDQAQV